MAKLNKLRHGQEITSEFLNELITTVNNLTEDHDNAELNKNETDEKLIDFETRLGELSKQYSETISAVPNFKEMISTYLSLNTNTIEIEDTVEGSDSPLHNSNKIKIVYTDNAFQLLREGKLNEKTIVLESVRDRDETTGNELGTETNTLYLYYDGKLKNFSTDSDGNVTSTYFPSITIGNDGYWYIDGDKTEIEAQGPQGIPGERGPAGGQGPQGPKGDRGLTGTQGIPGVNGKTPEVLFCSGSTEIPMAGDMSDINKINPNHKYLYIKVVNKEDPDDVRNNTPWQSIAVKGDTYYPKVENGKLYFTTTPPDEDVSQGLTVEGPEGPEGPAGPAPKIVFHKKENDETTEIKPTSSTIINDEIVYTYDADLFKGDKGDPGATGVRGPEGPQGPRGNTPIFLNGLSEIQLDETLETPRITIINEADTNYVGIRIQLPKPKDGTNGQDGQDGKDGDTPHIENGYWWVGQTNTHIPAKGLDGTGIREIEHIGNNIRITLDNGDYYTFDLPKGDQGDKGDKGDRGETGPGIESINTTGAANGINLEIKYNNGRATTFYLQNGPKGDKGDTGPAGADGKSIQIKGTVDTKDNLPDLSNTNDGDGYIVKTYIKSDNTQEEGVLVIASPSQWIYAGQVKGPKGDTGPQGPQGDTGPQGPQGEPGQNGIDGQDGQDGTDGQDGRDGVDGISFLQGNGAPTTQTGKNGDTYLDKSTCDLYVKVSSAWSKQTNIKGEPGTNPTVGENGHWWIGNTDTGVNATGPQGSEGPLNNILNAEITDDGKLKLTFDSGATTTSRSLPTIYPTSANIISGGRLQLNFSDNHSVTTNESVQGSDGKSITSVEANEYTEGEHEGDVGLIFKDEDGNRIGSEIFIPKGKDGANGQAGQDGQDGQDGITPHIAEDGYWYLGQTNTNVKAAGINGANGTNIYVIPQPKATLINQTSTYYKKGDVCITSDYYVLSYDNGWKATDLGQIKGANANKWFVGNYNSIAEAEIGDFCLHTTGEVYKKTSSGWATTGISIKGSTGSQGPQGSDGKSIYTGTSTDTITANIGDLFINSNTGDLSEKINSKTWVSKGNLKGTKGDNGTDGKSISTGTSLPTSGKVGDLFINSSTGELYQKNLTINSAAAWSSKGNLKGPKGDTGQQGTAGENAIQNVITKTWQFNTKGSVLNLGTTISENDLVTFVLPEYNEKFGNWYRVKSTTLSGAAITIDSGDQTEPLICADVSDTSLRFIYYVSNGVGYFKVDGWDNLVTDDSDQQIKIKIYKFNV